MPNEMLDLFDKLRGRDPEKEAEIKRKADESQAEYEKEHGPVPEEPGIEEDYTIENTGSLVFGGPAAGILKRGAGMAVNKASQKGIEKLKEKGPPRFDQAVASGEAKPGAGNFAKFIRGEDGSKKLPDMPAPERKPAGSVDLGNYWEKWKSTPMKKTEATTGFKPKKGIIVVNKK